MSAPTLLRPPSVEADRDSWRKKALCAKHDPEIFHPERGKSADEAKQVCSPCPVRATCLKTALNMVPHPGGVWGGKTARERRRLLRRGRNLIDDVERAIRTVETLTKQEKTHPEIAAALGEGWTDSRVRNLCRRYGIKSGSWHRRQRENREAVLAA